MNDLGKNLPRKSMTGATKACFRYYAIVIRFKKYNILSCPGLHKAYYTTFNNEEKTRGTSKSMKMNLDTFVDSSTDTDK